VICGTSSRCKRRRGSTSLAPAAWSSCSAAAGRRCSSRSPRQYGRRVVKEPAKWPLRFPGDRNPHLTKTYKGLQALKGLNWRSPSTRLRLPGAERRRQDDDDETAAGPHPADSGQHGITTRPHSVAIRDASAICPRQPASGSYERPRGVDLLGLASLQRPRPTDAARVEEMLELVALHGQATAGERFLGAASASAGAGPGQVNYPTCSVLDEPASALGPTSASTKCSRLMERLRRAHHHLLLGPTSQRCASR